MRTSGKQQQIVPNVSRDTFALENDCCRSDIRLERGGVLCFIWQTCSRCETCGKTVFTWGTIQKNDHCFLLVTFQGTQSITAWLRGAFGVWVRTLAPPPFSCVTVGWLFSLRSLGLVLGPGSYGCFENVSPHEALSTGPGSQQARSTRPRGRYFPFNVAPVESIRHLPKVFSLKIGMPVLEGNVASGVTAGPEQAGTFGSRSWRGLARKVRGVQKGQTHRMVLVLVRLVWGPPGQRPHLPTSFCSCALVFSTCNVSGLL